VGKKEINPSAGKEPQMSKETFNSTIGVSSSYACIPIGQIS
jgi:hypothetical protein